MDINATFSQARELARQGDRPAARRLLEEILQEEPDNEDVLLWYALLAPDRAEVIEGLKKVLEINPDNAQAQQRLAKLQGGAPASTPIHSQPFAYETPKNESAGSPPDGYAPQSVAPAAVEVPSTPLDAVQAGGMNAGPALIKRLDHLIALQEHTDHQINKINRVAQFFFWMTIAGIALSLISTCLALSGMLPLLGYAK